MSEPVSLLTITRSPARFNELVEKFIRLMARCISCFSTIYEQIKKRLSQQGQAEESVNDVRTRNEKGIRDEGCVSKPTSKREPLKRENDPTAVSLAFSSGSFH